MTLAGSIRFPACVVGSVGEFRQFTSENRDLIDERYRRELALASKDKTVTLRGSCGLCLLVTNFKSDTAGGQLMPDGRRTPNWREQQVCECEYALTSRERALLHVATPRLGSQSWYKAAVLGQRKGVANYLSKLLLGFSVWPRLEAMDTNGRAWLLSEAKAFHMVVSPDFLQFVPPLDEALAEVARVLMPGGIFLFTIPFYVDSEVTVSNIAHLRQRNGLLPPMSAGPVHQIGWDIMDRVREAGFSDCTAHFYWSEELGYLGPYNMIFMAFR